MSTKQATEYVSSNVFLDVPPSLVVKLSSLSSSPTQEFLLVSIAKTIVPAKSMALLSLRTYVAEYQIRNTVGDFNYSCIAALVRTTITVQELLELVARANDSLLGTEEGLSSVIDSINSTSKKKSIEPGTLRFFSNDLICYWTGKNWIKVER